MTVGELKIKLEARANGVGDNPNYPEKSELCIAKDTSGTPFLVCKYSLKHVPKDSEVSKFCELEIINEFPTKAECDLVAGNKPQPSKLSI
jgi:hypothetical protein